MRELCHAPAASMSFLNSIRCVYANSRMGRSGKPKGRVHGGMEYDVPEFTSFGEKPLYLCEPFVRNALIKGSFRTIVALPRYVHPYEWIANNRAYFADRCSISSIT